MVLKEPLKVGMRISASMLPTLVFTLVLAGILRDRFELPGYLFGGLIVYTLANTLIPGFVLGISPTSFPGAEDHHRGIPQVRRSYPRYVTSLMPVAAVAQRPGEQHPS